MSSSAPGTGQKTTVLLDPWTAAVATAAARRGDLQRAGAPKEGDLAASSRAFTSTATAQPQHQPVTPGASPVTSKFNLPQANVLHILRTAYYNAARNAHKGSVTPDSRSVAQSSGPQEAFISNVGTPGEGRESKRLKAAVGVDAAVASRRGAAALKRLCNTLGVFTQQQDLPEHNLSYAVASSRGWRVAMEDTYAAEVPLDGTYGMSMFAVYDGHGGAEVARETRFGTPPGRIFSARVHAQGRAIREASSAQAAFMVHAHTAAATQIATNSRQGDPAAAASAASCEGGGSSSGGGGAPAAAAEEAPGFPSAPASARGSAGTPEPPWDSGGSGGGAGSPRSRRHAALQEAFLSLDRQLADEGRSRELMALANPGALTVVPEAYGRRTYGGPYLGPVAGSTASVALVDKRGVTVAAVGDSRCILGSRKGGLIVMSMDHKGSDAAERERVVRAGCWVSASGRVCGELDMSRALGDADMKQAAGLPPHLQAVTADPTVMHATLEPSGRGGAAGCYLLLASDGLWNVLDSGAVHEFVLERLEAGLSSESICAQLCVEACVSERTAYDNVTVLLIQMHGLRPAGEVHVTTRAAGAGREMETMGGGAVASMEAEMVVEVEVGPVNEGQPSGGLGTAAMGGPGDKTETMVESSGADDNVLGGWDTVAAGGRDMGGDGEVDTEEGEVDEGCAEAQAEEVQKLAGRLWSEVASTPKFGSTLSQLPLTAAGYGQNEVVRSSVAVDRGSALPASSRRGLERHEQPDLPEGEASTPPLGDAMCRVWIPKSLMDVPERAAKNADHGLDSINGVDPLTQHAEEGSNTTHPSEQPDVISSYTGREAVSQTGGYGDEDGGYAQAPTEADATDPLDGVSARQEAVDAGYEEPAESGPDNASAYHHDFDGQAQQPEPGDDEDSSQRGPAAAGTRPSSGRPSATRPGSARPGSASARHASPSNSRPISASLITPDSVGLTTSGQPVSARTPGSSRPGSATTVPLSQHPPLPPPASVTLQPPPPLAFGPTIPEDRPLHPALIDRYIAPGLKAIEVEVEQGPGLPHRLVRVLMDLTQCEFKPYMGGFRNKRTGAVYHHAVTQTPRAPKYSEADRKLSRETQTVKIKQHSQQTVREQATQMMRPGMLLDETYDREVTPGRYQTADERDAIVLAATRCIQRWVRGWMGRRRAAYLRRKKAEREAFLREQELAAQTEAEEHRRREIQRRMHPRTVADFEVLYNELEAWRLQETRKIKEAGLPKEQEQQVLQQLLHKETKLLQTIDRLKINANQENKESRIQHTLNEMSRPKKFALRNGGKVDVHTPFTTRAKELQQLYNGLNLPLLTVDERLDVLLHVKWTVKEFDCDLTREIVDLIDREADLLNRGRSPKVLEGLRKRISSLFLNFIETPEFNPEAARFQIVPMDFETYLYEKPTQQLGKVRLAPRLLMAPPAKQAASGVAPGGSSASLSFTNISPWRRHTAPHASEAAHSPSPACTIGLTERLLQQGGDLRLTSQPVKIVEPHLILIQWSRAAAYLWGPPEAPAKVNLRADQEWSWAAVDSGRFRWMPVVGAELERSTEKLTRLIR
ncbi:hypothetical protein VOLCADRAFT_103627 [Volvox carteri f. nagariensis]|uniref:protein-serine/threonine phosphatase n=1 Tax=Volvox carteri f. nagariensis TaxID=3068 RepID=D8TNH4_VOLCA|nr:uncharacterized protein VOLCADRAFT_103627 [Volvox carteri f. nagariensis]EFJ50994.1 hypothetical protein VOLCADRAFT_103627 [Volvox carteri f. nagariensis]|eukprot:XP_002948006.1 hypothetical protein VOLCADRAFT_103627 [Volvox carteri f. nagariensis]